MLPYLSIPELKIYGPLAVRPFGVLLALSMVVGYWLSIKRARGTGLDGQVMFDCFLWVVLPGFISAHLFWAAFYNPHLVAKEPMTLLMVWDGISSFGGFFGGVLGAFVYFRRREVPVLPYLEALLFGFVPAWAIARLGCTIVFDHPGLPTGFILGMADKTGVVRHNLGLYEMLWTVVIIAVLYGLRNHRPFEGFHIALVLFLYAPVRIFFDSLRIDDRTWWGFTPGQYFSIVILVMGMMLVVRGLKRSLKFEV